MATESFSNTPTAILARLIVPEEPSLSPDAARSLLRSRFSEHDRQRMQELLAKAKDATLSVEEAQEAEAYDHIGHLLALLQSKARLSLKRSGLTP